MKKTIKGIIFDLDGVICYTDKYHYKAWKMLADREGIPFDEQINNRLRGISRMESLEIILEKAARDYSDEEKLAMASEKNEEYRRQLQQMTSADLPEEVRLTLDKLKECGYLLAIGSSSRNAGTILERIGLGNFFDAVSDGNNITKSKPDPEVFLKAAQFLGLKPEECLVVEDAGAGIEAASAGGFISAGIGEAARHPECTYPLRSISGLLKYV